MDGERIAYFFAFSLPYKRSSNSILLYTFNGDVCPTLGRLLTDKSSTIVM